MTKILQIRRGSAAQNDNLTGLAGEITADTDTNSVRVHDGAMPGGYTLARADLSNVSPTDFADALAITGITGTGVGTGNGNFDINSVPNGFWTDLFGQYADETALSNRAKSGQITIANTSYMEAIMGDLDGFDATHAIADVVLLCKTPEAGYAVGDIVYAFGIGNRANPRPIPISDTNGVRLRLHVAGENFWINHKTTGVQTAITNANWKAIMRVWY